MKKQIAQRARKAKAVKAVKSPLERMLNSDEYTEHLDNALTAAERELRHLMPALDPWEILVAFREHIKTHLAVELNNIKHHGHRSDDPNDTPDIAVSLSLSPREFDTVIAALRLWQKESAHIADGDGAIADLAEEHGDALTNEQIDALCERINCSPEHEDTVIVIEGGMVQSVFVPVADKAQPVLYSLIDYDALKEGMSDEDVLDEWNSFSQALKKYYRSDCKEEFEKYFENVLNEACDCDDRSWHGPEHDSACRVDGER